MSILTSVKDRAAGALRAQGAEYADGADRPLRGYVTVMATYTGVAAAVTAGMRLTGRQVPDGLSLADMGLCAAATFKLSRLLTKDPVTSPLRVPFTSYEGTEGPAELEEDARGGDGARRAVGEMVTCPFCASVWVATGLVSGLIFAPRATRTVMGALTALTGADLLHYTHALLGDAAS